MPQPGGQSGANARAGTQRPATAGSPQNTQNLHPEWQEQLRNMSPEERERFLQNDQRFHNLPPEQQAQIRQRFENFNKLSPEQKKNMENNAAAFEKLTPEQRQNVRTQLIPKWRQLTPEGRQEVKQRLNTLSGLSDAERNQKLNDPNFYKGLSPQEHDVLKQMGDLKLNPGAGGV